VDLSPLTRLPGLRYPRAIVNIAAA